METIHNNDRTIMISQFMDELLNNRQDSKIQIYQKYESIITSVTPMDIFYLDMYKQNTMFTIKEITRSADKFVNVFHQSLKKFEITDYKHDFFKLIYKESLAIENHLKSLKQLIKKDEMTNNDKQIFYEEIKKCEEINLKYIKIENILFPHIEDKVPSNMPIKVLWELHDFARKTLKEILEMLKSETFSQKEFLILIGEYYFLIYGINLKEQLILNPVAVQLLSKLELDLMFNEMLEYGFAFISETYSKKIIESVHMTNLKNTIFDTASGTLKLTEIELILNILPIDITFVDEFNKVKYFNNTQHRVFPRNPSIIGRDVKNCHPQKSVTIVENIIQSFRDGKKDSAEFWLNFNSKMIYIMYLALRNNQNKYVGVLEVSQDITELRALEGEKRLLDWQ